MTAPTATSPTTTGQPATSPLTASPTVYRRILRRETHSSRAALAIVLATVLVLVLAWIGTESVLQFFGRPALLAAPTDMLTTLFRLPEAVLPAALAASGAVAALLGLVLMLVAVTPGRRARHTAAVGRTAAVVDNAVIASALARVASTRANVDPDQVRVSVGSRTAAVTVRPTSGFPVDKSDIERSIREQLDVLNLRPTLRGTVTIEKRGVVGA